MKVTFFGATQTVTGSRFLVEFHGSKILVDCGLFQGLKELRLKNWEPIGLNAQSLDGVILTHAHLDHSGFIPLLVKEGFSKGIYSTHSTQALCQILLPDSGRIQEEDALHANLHHYSKHHPAMPLYTEKDAQKALQLFKPTPFNKTFEVGKFKIQFQQAGHILGASSVLISTNSTSLFFSGDLGRPKDILMKPPASPPPCDYLVMESTYGDRLHEKTNPMELLSQITQQTLNRKGTLLIPSFAVGRAQTLLFAFYELIKSNTLSSIPIYVDSPMTVNVTALYEAQCNEHLFSKNQCKDAFSIATYINSVEQSKALSRNKDPKVIISASGMCTGGRVLHHLEAFGTNESNTICLVGYQAKGTRGADLLQGKRRIKVHGRWLEIKSNVVDLPGFSAHADQSELLEWLSKLPRKPSGIFLVHGEQPSLQALSSEIQKCLQIKPHIAQFKESFHLK